MRWSILKLQDTLDIVVIIRVFATIFVVLAITALVIGAHDSALGRGSLGVLLGGITLMFFGAVLLIAAHQLLQLSRRDSWPNGERPHCREFVPAAFLLTMILGLYVFFSSIDTAAAQRPFVIAFALAMIAVATLGLAFFWGDTKTPLVRLGASVALGIVGITIGVVEFWYQNQYSPSRLGHAVSLDVSLQPAGVQNGYDVIRVTLDYKDVGASSMSVIGSAYTLTGSRVVTCHRIATPERVSHVFTGLLADPQRTRYMTDVWEEQPATLLAAGKFAGDGSRLASDVPQTRKLVFYVPQHRYQLLRVRAELFAIPAAVPLSQSKVPNFAAITGDHDLYGFWHIDDDSWLHDLVYGRERWVVLLYQFVSEPHRTAISPDFRVTARFPHPTWKESRPSDALVQKLFAEPEPSGSAEPFADAELALEPVAAPTAHDKVPATCDGR